MIPPRRPTTHGELATRRLVETLDTDSGTRGLWWLVAALFVFAMGALVAVGANGPADPHLADPAAAAGFGSISFRVEPTASGAAARAYCAYLADTDRQRARGLMGVSGLGGYDAMVFRYDSDALVGFHMRDTRIPLSIAWFDGSGRLTGTADMEPCPAGQETCRMYTPPGPIRTAVEVERGDLDRLGINSGSILALGPEGCTPD